jgi:hypothetical protein
MLCYDGGVGSTPCPGVAWPGDEKDDVQVLLIDEKDFNRARRMNSFSRPTYSSVLWRSGWDCFFHLASVSDIVQLFWQ